MEWSDDTKLSAFFWMVPRSRRKKVMVGDAGFSGGMERWNAVVDEGVGTVPCVESAGKMVGDVGCCTPNPMDVCEDLHDDELDLGGEWRDWHMDDPELESDDENEGNVRKSRKKKEKDRSEGKGGARSSNLVES